MRPLSNSDLASGWLAQRRQEARESLEQLSPPDPRDESWRFTDLKLLELDQFRDADHQGRRSRAPRAAWGRGRASATLAHQDGRFCSTTLHAAVQSRGVLFTELEAAAKVHSAEVAGRLGRLVGGDDPYSLSSLARWRSGGFLLVPDGVVVEAPVRLEQHYSEASAGTLQHQRHLIVVGKGSRVTLQDIYLAKDAALAEPCLVAPVVELFVDEGATVDWCTVQHLGSGYRQLGQLRARLAAGARLRSTIFSFGGDLQRSAQHVVLAGEGAESEMLGAYFPVGEERVEHWTVQEHLAPHTRSDLLHIGALRDRARALYYGTIRVDERAAGTDAYQSNRNLLLSERAKASTNPQLEIATNDVRCTHGATVGPLDAEVMFYLMSRGITRDAAEVLAVQGFFGGLLRRLNDDELAGWLMGQVELRARQGTLRGRVAR